MLFVVTLAAPFGVGYLITHSGSSSTSSAQPTPTSGATTSTAPATTTTTQPASILTRLAASCTAVPTGSPAPFLVVGKVGTGTDPDPRTSVPTRWVGIGFAQSIGPTVRTATQYSITAVLLPSGTTASTKGAPIDRAGSLQLWIFWDGSSFHKGIRTWDGKAWHMADETDHASDALTIQVQTTGAAFYWAGLQPGERYGFVTADAGGCSSGALGANLTPSETVPA